MSNAAATLENARTAIPMAKDPVRVTSHPKNAGPAKPATLPTALIAPTAPAAADALRDSVGIAQKMGR
jgi:hypothetical protein